VDLLAKLNRQAAGRITLMAGSGVNEQNIRTIRDVTGLHEFHFSGRESRPSGMQYVNPNLYMGRPGANEAALDYTTARRVAATIAQLLD
jgi:copper homeostasis protein